ncbi:RidA family protein [Methylobacterium sp. 22177]|uniref:RidA family protein n=1 Tax=Methylobacterium sp. 22177 TaxID=3453885 RepID=UPI003F82ACD7
MTTLNPPTVWAVPDQARTIYAHAREAPLGRTLFVSGQVGVAPDGRMRAEFAEQLGQAMANVEALLAAAGMVLADLRKVTFILTRTDDLCTLERVRQTRWASSAPAAVTVLVAAALARADALVEIEVTAVRHSVFGDRAAGLLWWIARWARGFAAARGRPLSRINEQGDWLLRDLGLERSDIQSPAERLDELRRAIPFQ